MNAGLPGTALGGLLYMLRALFLPVAEVELTLRSRTRLERWRQLGTQLALACGVVAAVVATSADYLQQSGVQAAWGQSPSLLVVASLALAPVVLAGLGIALRVWAGVLGDRRVVNAGRPAAQAAA